MRVARRISSSSIKAAVMFALIGGTASSASGSLQPSLQQASPTAVQDLPQPQAMHARPANGPTQASDLDPRRRIAEDEPTAARLRVAFSLATHDTAATDPAAATLAFIEHTRGLSPNTTTLTSLAYSLRASLSMASLTTDSRASDSVVLAVQIAIGNYLDYRADRVVLLSVPSRRLATQQALDASTATQAHHLAGREGDAAHAMSRSALQPNDRRHLHQDLPSEAASASRFAAASTVTCELHPVQTLAALQRRVFILQQGTAAFDERLAAVAETQVRATADTASQDALRALAQHARDGGACTKLAIAGCRRSCIACVCHTAR